MTVRILSPFGGVIQPIMSPEISWNRAVRSSLLQPVDTQTPFVILKFPDSRDGTLELLFSDINDALQAETILGHGAVFTYENTDRAAGPIRTNRVPNPRATGREFASGGNTITAVDSTGVLPGDDYRRGTFSTVVESAETLMHLTDAGVDGVPVDPGALYIASTYLHAAADFDSFRLDVREYDAGGVLVAGPTQVGTASNSQTWNRVDGSFVTGSSTAFVQPTAVWLPVQSPTVGTVIGVGASLLEDGFELRPFFDGDTNPGGGLVQWLGAADASPSRFTPDGAVTFDFVVTPRIELRRNMPFRSWSVRAGFREV